MWCIANRKGLLQFPLNPIKPKLVTGRNNWPCSLSPRKMLLYDNKSSSTIFLIIFRWQKCNISVQDIHTISKHMSPIFSKIDTISPVSDPQIPPTAAPHQHWARNESTHHKSQQYHFAQTCGTHSYSASGRRTL